MNVCVYDYVYVCVRDTHSVSRLCKPSKHLAPMLWIWLLWRCLEKGHKYFSTNQKLLSQKRFHTAIIAALF